jgi:hypothetical protein
LAIFLWKKNLWLIWLEVRRLNPNLKSPLHPIEWCQSCNLLENMVNSSVEYCCYLFLLIGFYFF